MFKRDVSELAIFGGCPISEKKLHSCRPYKADRELFSGLVDEAWDSQVFTNNGPHVRSFERSIQERLGVEHCIATSSGTGAMAILLSSLNISGEVILPSFTFVSTAQLLVSRGIIPVFCDINSDSWTIDVEHCRRLISPKTSAIIGTHIWGHACNIDEMQALCDEFGIQLIFDAAHAFGCSYKGQKIGRFGVAEVFSFHATKILHTFEGGAVTTNDEKLAQKLRLARNFGFTDFDRVQSVGTNAKMSEISAAMGLAGMPGLERRIQRTHAVFLQYYNSLSQVKGLSFYQYDQAQQFHCHYIVIQVDSDFVVGRDKLMTLLHAENIIARRYFYPGTDQLDPFKVDGFDPDSLPVTRKVCKTVMVLPAGSDISSQEVDLVCSIIKFVADNGEEIMSETETRQSRLEA